MLVMPWLLTTTEPDTGYNHEGRQINYCTQDSGVPLL